MIVAIYDAADKLVMFLDGLDAQVALNVPAGGRFEVITLERMLRRDDPPPAEDPPP